LAHHCIYKSRATKTKETETLKDSETRTTMASQRPQTKRKAAVADTSALMLSANAHTGWLASLTAATDFVFVLICF
jgi:hypothetical protein